MNLVMTGSGQIVEIQGTAEGAPFSRQEMGILMDLAAKGINDLVEIQKEILGPLTQRIGGVGVAKTRPGIEE
jgi:ribonuclease PH